MRFKDKIVIVTGAGRGIGKAAAISFAREGAKLVILSKTEAEIEQACKEIIEFNGQCMAIKADVSSEDDVKNVIDKTLQKYGTLDILINNAGRSSENKYLTDVKTNEFNDIIDINLKGAFLFSREALKIMKSKNYGKIVNIASMAGRRGIVKLGVYSASKFGLIGLTEAMASEVKDMNININAVNPGMVETRTFRIVHPSYNEPDLMQPADIAKVILFIASEDARCIKGSIIDVSNGQHLK